MLNNKLKNEYENSRLNFGRHRIIEFMKRCEKLHKSPNVTPVLNKNSKQSTEWRNEGNRIFLRNPADNEFAFELYNKSIAFAPEESIELSFAHANQSAILFRLEKYKECLQAIENCLSLNNYPEHLNFKILLRKTECLILLNDKIGAKKAYTETRNWVKEKISVEAQPGKLRQLNESFKKRPLRKETVRNIFDRVVKELNCSEPNEEVPALGNAVVLKYNEKFGRHLVAARYIKPGEIIAREKPYSVTLHMLRIYSNCWKCADQVWNCVPCDHCVNVVFCSEKCRDEAWEMYHEVECEVLRDLINVMNNKDLACFFISGFQTTIKAIKEFGCIENLRLETINIDKCKDQRIRGFSKDGHFRSDSYRSYYTLCNSAEISNDDENTEYFIKLGCFAAHILATKTKFFGKKFNKNWSDLYADEIVIFFAQLVTINTSIFSNNSYAIPDDNGSKCGGVFPAFSLLNHSCNPNIDLVIKGCEYYALVIRPIKNGEQIFISYLEGIEGLEEKSLTKDERRFQLLNKYKFVCECIACKDDWPSPENYPVLKTPEVVGEMFRIRKSFSAIQLYPEDSIKHQKVSTKLKNVIFHLKALCESVEFISSISTPSAEVLGLSLMVKDFLEELSTE